MIRIYFVSVDSTSSFDFLPLFIAGDDMVMYIDEMNYLQMFIKAKYSKPPMQYRNIMMW
ncbi:MAG: hypothetical protein IPG60_15010 [Bacteroidetes bacterium]|nr:hypothetical protein [Bacteroidota bacterium]